MKNKHICVVGLGYVGLPLAMRLQKFYKVTGYDVDAKRVHELSEFRDSTGEVESDDLKNALQLDLTTILSEIEKCDVYIITVPTPVDGENRPDMGSVLAATKSVATVLKSGNFVIYESTVYPGATDEECIPLLEKISHKAINKDFFVGYSPERINPGDKDNKIHNIQKLTSGSNSEARIFVDDLYSSILDVPTHSCSSIKIAEAAKVIENTQRDVNIALMNELAVILDTLEIDTLEVIEAAKTKWNFIPFRPGLVGGHCIGVDPYYLIHKAKLMGTKSTIISAAREISESMPKFIVEKLVSKLVKRRENFDEIRVLCLGLSFKENCPDTRNSRVYDVLDYLDEYNIEYDVYDPIVDFKASSKLITKLEYNTYTAVILLVAHQEFIALGSDEVKKLLVSGGFIMDLKGIFPKEVSEYRL